MKVSFPCYKAEYAELTTFITRLGSNVNLQTMLRRPSGFQLLVLQAEVHHILASIVPAFYNLFLFSIAVLFVSFASSLIFFILLVVGLPPPGSDAHVFQPWKTCALTLFEFSSTCRPPPYTSSPSCRVEHSGNIK